VFVLLVWVLGWGRLLPYMLGATSLVSLVLLMPAVTVLSFVLGVIGSSRARDAKDAQTLALFVALPILALVGVQVTGLVRLTPLLTTGVSAGLLLIDIVLVRAAVRLFGRESIVIRWR